MACRSIFKSVGRDKDQPPLAAYESNVNGMIFYTNTIHDFDLARWLMRDEVDERSRLHHSAIRPEVAKFGDVVASVVNLQYKQGAIGNIESYAQAVYGYDVRTEIVGSKGSIFVGSLERTRGVPYRPRRLSRRLPIIFFRVLRMRTSRRSRDFVQTMLSDRAPRVTGEDGLKALAIAVAAENSHLQSRPVAVRLEQSVRA